MYALIRLGKGQYYGSNVFGYYKDEITAKDEYERYIQDLHSGYYVVFNPTKNCLWKWYSLQSIISVFTTILQRWIIKLNSDLQLDGND